MRYRILPYRQGSKSARALADALGGRVLKLEGSKFIKKPFDMVINWGNVKDQPATVTGLQSIINDPDRIKAASNKLKFFRLMADAGKGDLLPRWWDNRHSVPSDAYPIVCRTVLAGHSGEGIVIADTPEQLVPAGLYVEYVKKDQEYRIHVGKRGNESIIIARQRKARRHAVPDNEVNWRIRNHDNGFVYVREGVSPPALVEAAAIDAMGVTSLDFGAVDVIYNAKKGKAYVLEINTAPGLEGQTVTDYADFFRSLRRV